MFWEKPGEHNTDNTIQMAVQRASQLGIQHIVVASCSGSTIKKVHALANHLNLVCVTHHSGFAQPGTNEMETETRKFLESLGIKILTTTHLLAGVDRAIRNHFGGVYPAEIIAQTLRMFGQGVKVAVEVAVMALDAGIIPYDQDIISIGGSVQGADAAIIIRPSHSNHFFDTEIREIICMPHVKKKV